MQILVLIINRLFDSLLHRQQITIYISKIALNYNMGKVDKGINCSVQGCDQSAERSMSSSKASMEQTCLYLPPIKELIFAEHITRNGKKLPKKTAKTNERDGGEKNFGGGVRDSYCHRKDTD